MSRLTDICWQALESRIATIGIVAARGGAAGMTQAKQRLRQELKAIETCGDEEAFLLAHDVAQFAASQRIALAPGFGLSPGSLVAFLTGVTAIDPLRYGLLFERFYNASAERPQKPYFLMVCQPEDRPRLMDYLQQTHHMDYTNEGEQYKGTMAPAFMFPTGRGYLQLLARSSIRSRAPRPELTDAMVMAVSDHLAHYMIGRWTGLSGHALEEAMKTNPPCCNDLLAETGGRLLYVEQMMRIMHELSGLPLEQATTCLRAIGMRKTGLIAQWRRTFLDACAKAGIIDHGMALLVWQRLTSWPIYTSVKAEQVARAMLRLGVPA